jgi:hypothetical protein
MRSLCESCSNRCHIQTDLGGTILNVCRALKDPFGQGGYYMDLSKTANVTRCSMYTSYQLPWVFEQAAWIITKDDEGLIFKRGEEKMRGILKKSVGFRKDEE